MGDARDHRGMSSTTRCQRRYDHRLRTLVQTTGDIDLGIRHGVPRSTARGWLTRTSTAVVTLDVLELDTVRLQHEVMALRRRIARLVSWLRLVVLVLKVSGCSPCPNSVFPKEPPRANCCMRLNEHDPIFLCEPCSV